MMLGTTRLPSGLSQSPTPSSCGAQLLRSVSNVGSLSKMLERGQQLPEAYRWSSSETAAAEDDPAELEDEVVVPVIDLAELDRSDERRKEICEEMRSACREWGAFQVVNHGVPDQVVERARRTSLDLFALPESDKLRAERPPGTLFGYGATRMASFFNRLMWSEAFTMMGSPHNNFEAYARKLCVHSEQDFCKSFEEYDKAMRGLALLITDLILHGLEASEERIHQHIRNFWGMIHMNFYPPCPSPSEAMGLASHTDSSCLTIMHQGSVGGLQVKRGDKWIAIKPVPGAFVIQVGDMLQLMSNNVFHSALHRALVNERFERLSLVYFFTPPPTVSICPIHPSKPLYRCLTWNEYLQVKAKLFMGALDHFLLPE
ncbi:hypothetical protein SELMODRAFT_450789 [Selaginella moellendorffii]|uniref:Uncharacterized protein GA3ox-1 n=2 Tax=Selaginella moellendorffii TaxID=88036 RepID=D8SVD7_SELML|nr:gibberellin 3-beta-dioxygenase 2 [Selaginella moellendorffii]EFJ11595.1 hypothetical protein SELMODRAFT_450789 [Selaginella moellendorffii]|eukprot:XP_002987280.1 gibberellin 3-beta-dioxygenase 2 [Selaginella moellendorffii]